MNRTLLAMAVAAILTAIPMTMAHQGNPGTGVIGQPYGEPNRYCWSTQNPHDYGLPVPGGTDPVTAVMVEGTSFGTMTAADHSIPDCDQNGLPGGDGDPEYGVGGGAFPRFQHHWYTICGQNFNPHHTGNYVEVQDVVLLPVKFIVGGDPSEPTYRTDLVTGDTTCSGDGCVCPNTDPDDWLLYCYGACIIPASTTHTDLDPTSPVFGLPLARPTVTHWTGHGLVWVPPGQLSILDPDQFPCVEASAPPPDLYVNPNCLSPDLWLSLTGHIYWP